MSNTTNEMTDRFYEIHYLQLQIRHIHELKVSSDNKNEIVQLSRGQADHIARQITEHGIYTIEKDKEDYCFRDDYDTVMMSLEKKIYKIEEVTYER
jgi:hypothetical protein